MKLIALDANSEHLYSRMVVASALASAGLLILMVGIGFSSGVSQQYFELVTDLNVYAAQMLEGAAMLRLILALDNVFIACYCTMLIALIARVWDNRLVIPLLVILSASLLGGFLDYVENHHILSMLLSLENGIQLNAEQVQSQMVQSALKWHLAYFSFFLLGCLLQAKGFVQTVFKYSLILWQLPLGVVVYTTWGTALGEWAFYLRYLNLAFGFVFFAILCSAELEPKGVRANMART